MYIVLLLATAAVCLFLGYVIGAEDERNRWRRRP